MNRLVIGILTCLLLLAISGCKAADSLIFHPISVLIDQHRENKINARKAEAGLTDQELAEMCEEINQSRHELYGEPLKPSLISTNK
jgi:hypothetical protein